MKSGRKQDDQIGETRLTGTFRGNPMPNLKAGEVICPVCDQAGIVLVGDGKPGVRYRHEGRIIICRRLDQ